MDDSGPLLQALPAPSTGEASSGGGKRKAKNTLPQVFLVVSRSPRRIVGGILLCGAYETDGGEAFVVPGGYCSLIEPLDIVAGQATHSNGVFRVSAELERRARTDPCAQGLNLNGQFSSFAASFWRCWPLTSETLQSLGEAGPPSFIRVKKTLFRAMGVDAVLVNSIEDVVPSNLGDRNVESDPVAIDADNTGAASSDRVDDHTRVEPNSGGHASGQVLEHLHGHAVPRNAGVVTHSFEPRILIVALQFWAKLKPSVTLNEGLAAAAPLLLNAAGSVVAELPRVILPSEGRLREATVRLELLATLWEREEFENFVSWRYLNPDSSPQLGWDWLVMREDVLSFPKNEFITPDQFTHADLNRFLTSRTGMLSILGRGRSSVIKKAFNISTEHKLRSATVASYEKLQGQVFGILSDMGTEKGICDVSNMEPVMGRRDNTFKIAHAMMYPNALYMPEHLHILFNSLRNGVENLSDHKWWIRKLRAVENFLADKSMRRLFMATCLHGHHSQDLFVSYSNVAIDWRWETLCKALNQLIPLFEILQERFDSTLIKTSDEGKVDASMLTEVEEVLRIPYFLELSETIRVVGNILEKTAHRLEGCECHREVWISRGSWKRKAGIMKRKTGHAGCVMKGRQAVWFQMEGLDNLCAELQQCTSDFLQKRIQAMETRARHGLVRLMGELTDSIVEELRDKFHFHSEIPYKLVRCFAGEVRGDWSSRARSITLECITEFDSILASGKGDKLHRVAHRLLGHGTECRRQLEMFGASSRGLKEFPTAWMNVLQYVLIPVVGRRVEGAHAQIKRAGLLARNAQPPYISASLRLNDHLALLQSSQAFHDFCCRRWRSTTVLDDLLVLVKTKDELRAMNRMDKLHAVYQCSLEAEFRSMRAERESRNNWLVATTHARRGKPVPLAAPWQLCVVYLKSKLERGKTFCLPEGLYLSSLVGADDVERSNPDPASDAIAVAASHATPTFSFDEVGATVWFEMLNAHPQRRAHVSLHHLSSATDIVHVVRRSYLCMSSQRQVGLVCESDKHEKLRLHVLAQSMHQTLSSLFVWDRLLGSAQTFRRPHDFLEQFRDAREEDRVLLPRVNDLVQRRASTSPSIPAHEVVSHYGQVSDKRALILLNEVAKLQATSEYAQGVPVEALQRGGLPDVQALLAAGALRPQVGGAFAVTTDVAWTKHISLQVVHSPRLVVGLDSFSPESKLDCVMALRRRGWRCNTDNEDLAPYKPQDDVLVFRQSFSRPTSYFLRLLLSETLFENGVQWIPHDRLDVFYQCLLRLRQERLQEFLKVADNAGESVCRDALRDSEPLLAMCDVPEEDVQPGAGGDGQEDDEHVEPAVLLDQIQVPLQYKRCKVEGERGTVKVYFAQGTGVALEQRTYANCLGCERVNCFQWRQASDFESREHVARYFYCWATSHAEFPSRTEHMKYRPLQADVDAIGDVSIVEW